MWPLLRRWGAAGSWPPAVLAALATPTSHQPLARLLVVVVRGTTYHHQPRTSRQVASRSTH